MLQRACAGTLFVKFRIMNNLSYHRAASIIVGVQEKRIFIMPEGFVYQGIYLACAPVLIIVILRLLPLEKLPLPVS